jgi:hypothetical protein
MSNYILLIYTDVEKAAGVTPEEGGALHDEYVTYTQNLRSAGAWVAGDPLQGVETAKTVSKGGVITDGPFADITEHLGGYYLIDVDSIETACEWAAKLPGVARGLDRIEVRPLMEFSMEMQA